MKYTDSDIKLIVELTKSLNIGRPSGGGLNNAIDAIRQYDYIKEQTSYVEDGHNFKATCYNQYGLILQFYEVEADCAEDAKDKVLKTAHNEFPCDHIDRIEIVDESGESYWFKEGEIYG